MIKLSIQWVEVVSLTQLQKNRLNQFGLQDTILTAESQKDAYFLLIQFFVYIYNKMLFFSKNKNFLGLRDLITIIAYLSSIYLVKFENFHKTSINFSDFQVKLLNLLESIEKSNYDFILKKLKMKWKHFHITNELFAKNSINFTDKLNISISIIHNSGNTTYISDIRRVLVQFYDSLQRFTAEYNEKKNSVQNLDNELLDMMHEIELLDVHSIDISKLKENRLARRKEKDRLELLEPFNSWCVDRFSTQDLKTLIDSLQKAESYHQTREYVYKSHSFKNKGSIKHNGVD